MGTSRNARVRGCGGLSPDRIFENEIEFKGLPEPRTLEENLQAPRFNRTGIDAIAENLKISGLEQFPERMI